MLWDSNTIHVLTIVCTLIVYAIVVLSSTVSSTTLLIHDGGSYDAGIPSTTTSMSGTDGGMQGIVLYLLLHEVLVV